jgi:hypothetical protein
MRISFFPETGEGGLSGLLIPFTLSMNLQNIQFQKWMMSQVYQQSGGVA